MFDLKFITIGYGSGYGSDGYRVANGGRHYGGGHGGSYGGYGGGYGYNPEYNPPNYRDYIRPIPYSNVSQYIAPHQYHDYARMLHSFYNVPYLGGNEYHDNNYSTGAYNKFKMVVAVAVISGSLGTPNNPQLQGTLYFSEIYPRIVLVSGVVSG